MCAFDQARPKEAKLQWLGRVQASPKISALDLNAARNVQMSGRRTSNAQITSAMWPRPARRLTCRRCSVPAGAACERGCLADGVEADTSSVWVVVMAGPQNSM